MNEKINNKGARSVRKIPQTFIFLPFKYFSQALPFFSLPRPCAIYHTIENRKLIGSADRLTQPVLLLEKTRLYGGPYIEGVQSRRREHSQFMWLFVCFSITEHPGGFSVDKDEPWLEDLGSP